jgi:hypothetical protein
MFSKMSLYETLKGFPRFGNLFLTFENYFKGFRVQSGNLFWSISEEKIVFREVFKLFWLLFRVYRKNRIRASFTLVFSL